MSYWQVLARVLRPGTTLLAMVRLAGTCAAAALLGCRLAFSEDDLYANGAWLERRHAVVERRLWEARPAPPQDQLFLYDVTSSYLECNCNALAAWGYNRDRKQGKKQVVVGLLTDSLGEPVSVQVYRGNTSDLKTFAQQVHKVKKELGCQGVTLVGLPTAKQAGDRGMIRSDQKAAAQKADFHYVSALTKPQIEKLLAEKALQLEKLCVMEWVEAKSGKVISRHLPDPSPRQKQLLDALKLTVPAAAPQAKVSVVTRKKINKARKDRVK